MIIMVSNPCTWFLGLLALSVLSTSALSDDTAYAKSLLKFKQSLTNPTTLDNWIEPVDKLCSWNGILCTNGSFMGLKLDDMGLSGIIDVDSLSELPLLRLSAMNNNFSGPFPSGVNKLVKLRGLFLANNSFSGAISDDAFKGMKGMRRVVIGYNRFTGNIPLSLLGLPKLVDLQIQNNRFGGRIPDFWQADLSVDFSNNLLEGVVPPTLVNQNVSSFLGNKNLCGKPLNPCKPNKSIKKIAFVIASIVVFSLAAFTILIFLCRKRSRPLKYQKSFDNLQIESPTYYNNKSKNKNNKKLITTTTNNNNSNYKNINIENGKLYFVRNDRERFELEELLRASAEVLGSGSFGSSYKALLPSGFPYVVRRFREMNNAGKEQFYEHLTKLGRIKHVNLLPIVAFYYTKEEKLLITDFVENGSLASHLHGKRSPNQPPLGWPTRLKIIKGVARGLAHLYKEFPNLPLPHGHLKSSNVLLDGAYTPLLSDYALSPLISKDHAHQFMVAHKSPESAQNDRVSRKTDVWSLGILILELITGRFPANYLKRGRGPSADLANWVNSVVGEELSGEVFDKEMRLSRNGEGEMVRLLRIGMCCCEWNVDKRWDFASAFEKIEELNHMADFDDDDDDDDEFSSSYGDDEFPLYNKA
ncbi:hypothetical protein ABFS82_05G122400 [Erythranthe guttata]